MRPHGGQARARIKNRESQLRSVITRFLLFLPACRASHLYATIYLYILTHRAQCAALPLRVYRPLRASIYTTTRRPGVRPFGITARRSRQKAVAAAAAAAAVAAAAELGTLVMD